MATVVPSPSRCEHHRIWSTQNHPSSHLGGGEVSTAGAGPLQSNVLCPTLSKQYDSPTRQSVYHEPIIMICRTHPVGIFLQSVHCGFSLSLMNDTTSRYTHWCRSVILYLGVYRGYKQSTRYSNSSDKPRYPHWVISELIFYRHRPSVHHWSLSVFHLSAISSSGVLSKLSSISLGFATCWTSLIKHSKCQLHSLLTTLR